MYTVMTFYDLLLFGAFCVIIGWIFKAVWDYLQKPERPELKKEEKIDKEV